jgi:hypothetical protein
VFDSFKLAAAPLWFKERPSEAATKAGFDVLP